MADPEFARAEIDTQFLDRRPDLLEATMSADRGLVAAVAAALAEDDARRQRRPSVAGVDETTSAWTRLARQESLRS